MHRDRFDTLSRGFARAVSRRRGLALAIGLVAAGGLDSDATAARTCRRAQSSCTRNAQCCTGTCRKGAAVPRAQRNRCGCGEGLTVCNERCVELGTVEHCGFCGKVCDADAGERCWGGDIGCAGVCEPLGQTWGAVTVDDVILPSTNGSYYEFAEANGLNWPNVINCTSDADCDAYVCPVTVDREGIIPTLGCGCISYRCADGVFEDHYSWHKPEKYHCGVMFDY